MLLGVEGGGGCCCFELRNVSSVHLEGDLNNQPHDHHQSTVGTPADSILHHVWLEVHSSFNHRGFYRWSTYTVINQTSVQHHSGAAVRRSRDTN